jgi:hypothetical protein
MLRTIFRKRAHIIALAVILVVSFALTDTPALAASKLIKAKKGGTIKIADGVKLKIEKSVVKDDTEISADMLLIPAGSVTNMPWKQEFIHFIFGPHGTVFYDAKYEEKMEKEEGRYNEELEKLNEEHQEKLAKIEEDHGEDPEKYNEEMSKEEEHYAEELQDIEEKHQERIAKIEEESKKKEVEAELEVSLEIVEDALSLILEGEDIIEPEIKGSKVIWRIPHFSLYYLRRR